MVNSAGVPSDSIFTFDFTTPGFVPVSLTIENDLGCIVVVDTLIQIVEEPSVLAASIMILVLLCELVNLLLSLDNFGVDLTDVTDYKEGDRRDTVTWTFF